MAQITFNIDDAKIPRIKDAMKGLFPIPEDSNGNPLFTETQWAKESVRRFIVKQVQRWEQTEAIDQVRGSIIEEDDLVS